jgi:hypothetical protein
MTCFCKAVGDRQLLSDAPPFDQYWLDMLAEAAGMKATAVGHVRTVLGDLTFDGPHRAEPDARGLALLYKQVTALSLH